MMPMMVMVMIVVMLVPKLVRSWFDCDGDAYDGEHSVNVSHHVDAVVDDAFCYDHDDCDVDDDDGVVRMIKSFVRVVTMVKMRLPLVLPDSRHRG